MTVKNHPIECSACGDTLFTIATELPIGHAYDLHDCGDPECVEAVRIARSTIVPQTSAMLGEMMARPASTPLEARLVRLAAVERRLRTLALAQDHTA